MSEPVVRPARPGDADQVAELLGVLGYPSDVATTRALLQRAAASADDEVLVATAAADPDRVLGFVAVQVGIMFTELSSYARLTAVVVGPQARRRGIGRALVRAAEELARARGCAFVELTSGVRPGRQDAHAFYPALGYQDTGHIRYRRELERLRTDR